MSLNTRPPNYNDENCVADQNDFISDDEYNVLSDDENGIIDEKIHHEYNILRFNDKYEIKHPHYDEYCIRKRGGSKRIIYQTLNSMGYYVVKLDGHEEFLHIIVATQYLYNGSNYKCVNHLNLKRKDNRISNLTWSDQSNLFEGEYRKSIDNIISKDEFENNHPNAFHITEINGNLFDNLYYCLNSKAFYCHGADVENGYCQIKCKKYSLTRYSAVVINDRGVQVRIYRSDIERYCRGLWLARMFL
jgi:hypothetical protein